MFNNKNYAIMKIKRIITRDYKNDCLIIKGDYAPRMVTIYLVTNIFGEKDFGIYLTEEGAESMAAHLNKKNNTNTFMTSQRTLFTA